MNHRHEDFQSTAIQEISGTYELEARQTPDGTPKTYTPIVKPGNADLTKENAANLAGFNGAKTSLKTVRFPDEFSPEWAGAPAIILLHFCGVVA